MFAPWAIMLVDLLVECVVKSTLLIAVVGAVLWVLRVTDANLRHRTWAVVLLTMLALPALGWMLPAIEVPGWLSLPSREVAVVEEVPLSIGEPVLPEQVSPYVMPRLPVAAEPRAVSMLPLIEGRAAVVESPIVLEPAVMPADEPSISWQTVVAAVYLMVATVLVVRLGLGMILTWRLVRRGRPLSSEDHTAFAGEHAIVESSDVRTPATVGLWYPTILLPSDWRCWSDSAVALAIAHERSHVRRRDAFTTLLANGNAAVYWFHPLAWWLRRKLADLAEQVCDDEVLRTHGDRACYAETLLTMASRLAGHKRVSPLLVPMARQAQVETRIEAVIDDRRPLCRRLGWRGLAMLLAVAVPLVTGIAALKPASPAAAGEAVNREAERSGAERVEEETTKTTNQEKNAKAAENTADSWPDETAVFPSPIEGEIAARAWKLLRLKTLPTTAAEQEAGKEQKVTIGVKIVDGPFRLGRPFPLMLGFVNKEGISSYKDLSLALDHIEKEQPTEVALEVFDANFKVRFKLAVDVQSPAGRQRPEVSTGQTTKDTKDTKENLTTENTESTEKTKILVVEFPKALHSESSRQQTLAALQAQGYEAKLSADKRHDGSLVTNLSITVPAEAADARVVWEASYSEGGLRPRVVLLDQAGKPLERKPISDLFPRSEPYPPGTTYVSETTNPTSPGQPRASATGQRPEINAEAAKSAEAAKNSLFPTLAEQRAADLAYNLLGVELEKLDPAELERVKAKGYQGGLRVVRDSGRQDIQGDLGSGDLLVGLHVWPTESLKQVQEILTRYDMPELTPLKYYAIRKVYGGEEKFSGDSKGKDEVVTGRINVDLDAWAEKEEFKRERLKSRRDWQPRGASSKESPFAPGGGDSTQEALYDGKTFDEWRQMLQSELKSEKRIECLDALAAFGRAGKGDAVADAILTVAGEFDWKSRGEPLQEKCLTTFYRRLNSQVALKAVLKAADSENEQIVRFAELAALNLGHLDIEIQAKLKEKFPNIEFPRSRGAGGYGRAQSNEPSQQADLSRQPEGLDVFIDSVNKKPLVGSRNTYTFIVANTADAPLENVELAVTFPPELVPDMASVKAPDQAKLVGNEVRFQPIASLRANERVSFTITASVLKAGEGEIVVKAKSKDSPEKEVHQMVRVADE
jgi:beta-lactamase regulating signal transducer with metallopeptidase domain